GWNVLEVDGHNIEEVVAAFRRFKHTHFKPTVIIAHTIKGKGVSFMEDNAAWHGKAPNREQAALALEELCGGCC
ncbi:MAG: transketolase, partial [Thermovirga sp.]|nr:transketolase [Thermovirga sp.]